MILGVSEGGATKEGLECALEIADEAFIFHDPRRTFHPKVYFASSPSEYSLFVGSSNLTAGGLSWNYESSIWIKGSRTAQAPVSELTLFESLTEWFDNLLEHRDSCRRLTPQLIENIEDSQDILIGSESRARRAQTKNLPAPEDNDSLVASTISGLFQPVKTGLRPLPHMTLTVAAHESLLPPPFGQIQGSHNTPWQPGTDAPLPDIDIQRRWLKEMDNTAAQQVKSAKSNPTGNLRLSREEARIDHTVYFRNEFFANVPWSPRPNKEEEQEVVVGFHTWIDGMNLGTQELRISHNPSRIANQGNVPTVLHWGPIGQILKRNNFVGFWVNLELTKTQDFNLIISKAPRGEYIS